ncbi:hypothetical protein FEE95_11630 [Maribacter algarum]|uniref:DUF1330 domain-containing protein n=1 Tax=Maribacter algarum (ex Zhang et al. 2020) TaxID=2578118 RepID=A0A5S3QHX0_9FLAO|nr:hypothetical protein [Maribacter algarum]TMM57135.1 hypothetical protein FEE95_11630 [Maribacter algarum]
MKFTNLILLIAVLLVTITAAQEKTKSFEFKKGEVLDIILLNQVENSSELFKRYKETAFPVAFEYSYQPQPGFGISKLTLGTNKAQAFLFGKWSSLKKRVGFLENISKRLPDFHQQRRDLFPYFGLTYYEMKQDLQFSVDTSKFNVATALWSNSNKKDRTFFKKWVDAVKKSGGTIILTLENGTSPLGYYYNADILCIVEWQNENAFQTFTEKHPLSFYQSLRNVHQFVIQ